MYRPISFSIPLLLANSLLAANPQDVAFFEQHVRPLLANHCVKCHGEKKQESRLRLDSREAAIQGGDSGPAIVPNKPDESLILEALRHESFEMPPSGKLPASEIEEVRLWIAAGAVWPEDQVVRADRQITEQDRQWWAFQPIGSPQPPEATEWTKNPIDQFVAAKLKAEGLVPAPQASPETLVRRLYFDVLGVPPTPEDVRKFAADPSDEAWSQLVEQLLDDPRYGEHWARYWLDLVRYSESDGWNQDAYRAHIWRYRDFVINAINGDMPYSQFVLEQLAGDELNQDEPRHLEAAGFLRLGIYEYNQRDARGHWNDIMNEMTDVAGDVFFGMSMACARCHDHKFDPVLQRDYFKLRAFFEPVIWRDDLQSATAKQRAAYDTKRAAWEQATKEIRDELAALEKRYVEKKWQSTVDKFPLDIQACFNKPAEDRDSWEEQMAYLVSRQFLEEGGGPFKSLSKEDKAKREALLKRLAEFDQQKPAPLPAVMTVTTHRGEPALTTIPDAPDQAGIAPGFLSVLEPAGQARTPREFATGKTAAGRRTALAKWIAAEGNGLTHRVAVNRIWQRHFDAGIVRTPNDFGHNGTRPTHPALLDFLTRQFIEAGGRAKPIHRLILNSATWRQSSRHPKAEQQQAADPFDQLLWRAPVRRLRAEQVRDAMLSVSGELDSKRGGPSVDEKTPRRGIYVKSFRNKTETFMHLFDMAGGLKSVAVRNTTTTPTQSLLMMNGDYALARAKRLAQRAMQDANGPDVIDRVFWLAWGRGPAQSEREAAASFINDRANDRANAPAEIVNAAKLTDFCHVLLNSNEFLYVD